MRRQSMNRPAPRSEGVGLGRAMAVGASLGAGSAIGSSVVHSMLGGGVNRDSSSSY